MVSNVTGRNTILAPGRTVSEQTVPSYTRKNFFCRPTGIFHGTKVLNFPVISDLNPLRRVGGDEVCRESDIKGP